MKKILFASTALIFVAGAAAADVVITGSASMGLKYDQTTKKTEVANDITFKMNGTATTDNGISLGAIAELNDADEVHDTSVYMSTGGLKLTVGAVEEAADSGINDIGYDGIGVDDIVEKMRTNTKGVITNVKVGSGGVVELVDPDAQDDQIERKTEAATGWEDHNVNVAYTFGDFTASASTKSGTKNEYQIGLSGKVNGVSVGAGFGKTGTDDIMNLSVGYSMEGMSGDVLYREVGTQKGYGLNVGYTTGDITISAAYAKQQNGEKKDAWGIGLAYDMGGAKLAAGFGEVDNQHKADLGISFDF